MLYHISKDVSLKPKKFTPRIPKYRLDGEDDKIKRVSFADSLIHCFSSFPYKNDTYYATFVRDVFLNVYSIEDFKNKDWILHPTEIQKYLPDALDNNEYWITKELVLEPKIIKVTSISYSNHCRYSGYVNGICESLKIENEIEDVDRTNYITIIGTKNYKKFSQIANKYEISFNILDEKYAKYLHLGNFPSSRKFPIYNIEYTIPKGVSAKYLWYFLHMYSKKFKTVYNINRKNFNSFIQEEEFKKIINE